MMDLKPPNVYETYQDVKNNLWYWTALVLIPFTMVFVLFGVLNTSQRKEILDTLLAFFGPWKWLVGSGVLLVVTGMLSWVLVWGIQIHDAVYDRFVIKWREDYDVNFILKELTRPFAQEIHQRFFREARSDKHTFMKPYYHFVGDRRKGISENARIRFYERITWYWITQLNEIFLSFLLILGPLWVVFEGETTEAQRLAVTQLILMLLWVCNRFFVRVTRKSVSKATQDEIEEILESPENVEYLKQQFQKLLE